MTRSRSVDTRAATQPIPGDVRALRAAVKPLKLHRTGCIWGFNGTCLCGAEPTASPTARAAHGEIPITTTFRAAFDRAFAGDTHDESPWGRDRGGIYETANAQWRAGWAAGLAARS